MKNNYNNFVNFLKKSKNGVVYITLRNKNLFQFQCIENFAYKISNFNLSNKDIQELWIDSSNGCNVSKMLLQNIKVNKIGESVVDFIIDDTNVIIEREEVIA